MPVLPLVRIKGGSFEMGDVLNDHSYKNEKPVHTVAVADFYLGKTEVTFAQYDAYCAATGAPQPGDAAWGRRTRPAINVSWFDAIRFCNWLSEQEGLSNVYTLDGDRLTVNWNANGYRLPTEAEWEYAARSGGRNLRFGTGKNTADSREINFDGRADFKTAYSLAGTYRGKTVPVASLGAANLLGLYDMSGNVWEWCWDWYGPYPAGVQTNPRGPDNGKERVLRGGSWDYRPVDIRVAHRRVAPPTFRSVDGGFRVARNAD